MIEYPSKISTTQPNAYRLQVVLCSVYACNPVQSSSVQVTPNHPAIPVGTFIQKKREKKYRSKHNEDVRK
jgi:hypothetical protein